MICRIYTDPTIIPQGLNPVIMLYPFLGSPKAKDDDPDMGRFDDYLQKGKELFEITSKENCDIYVLPFDFSFDEKHQPTIQNFILDAKNHNKEVLLFYNADDDRPIELNNVIVFRTSFYFSVKSNYEHAFPGWSADFLKVYAHDQLKPGLFLEKPVVGYCGYVDYVNSDWRIKIRKWLGKDNSKSWEKLRGKAVRNVLQSSKVQANFIIRDGFWAEGIQDKHKARVEYVNNMLTSDYAICCRGGGNFSYRLYEVMSLGKIPIFINTDAVLPWMNEIPWKEIMVWVEEDELNLLVEKTLTFHNLHVGDFESLQQKIRDIYVRFLSPVGFYTKLAEFLIHSS